MSNISSFKIGNEEKVQLLPESTLQTIEHATVLNPASKEFQNSAPALLKVLGTKRPDSDTISITVNKNVVNESGITESIPMTNITLTFQDFRDLAKIAQRNTINRKYIEERGRKTGTVISKKDKDFSLDSI